MRLLCTASSRPCSTQLADERRAAPTRSCSTSASRRCSSTGPSAASRTRPTRRSTCAWTPRPSSTARRRRQRGRRARARRRSSAATARSATRARSRARSCGAARKQPFERTGDLVETIKQAIPAPARFGEGHPAKRVFQALRIEVNDELGSLERALPAALEILRPRRPARGDLVPLARGPDRQALPARRRSTAARARPTSRSASAARSPRCGRRRAARSGRPPPRSPATRARSRRGSASAVKA